MESDRIVDARSFARQGQHSYEERGADCYETPPEAVHALLKVENLPAPVWEPACGPGSIVRVLRKAGHPVFYSDLHDYGHSVSDAYSYGKIDFLKFDVEAWRGSYRVCCYESAISVGTKIC